MNFLAKNIIATVIYYDILNYPLTSFEIWKYLISSQETRKSEQKKVSLFDVIKNLENEELRQYFEEYQGFYFLRGRKKLVEQRIERNKISENKFRIIKKAVWFLRFSPFIRMIAVTGRIAMKNADKKSDLDLLIALKKNRIFIGRILATAIVHILGIRRYKNKITDRICLNYFITNKSLEISLKDLFSSSEYFFAVPVFGWETFRDFHKKNDWIRNYRPNFEPRCINSLKLIEDSNFSKFTRKAGEILIGWNFIENIFKKIQTKRIDRDPRTHKAGSFVTASNNELVFLPNPQGPEVFSIFEEKMRKMINKNMFSK